MAKEGKNRDRAEQNAGAEEKPQNALPPEKTGTSDRPEGIEAEHRETPDFPIVGIGASAGGLEAFQQFFTNMPADCGMAFVLVQHLDPTHRSILSDLVGQYTSMKVVQVEDGMQIAPNCVYIIPPDRDMAILHRRLQLIEPARPRGQRMPIDFFFRSLAQDRGDRAVCIVLSGTGTEGSLGLRAVKGEGGMAMVQAPDSAGYDGMPRSAVATGLADYILPPGKMPEQLLAYIRHPSVRAPEETDEPASGIAAHLQKIFVLIRSHTGHDFSQYKENTIIRRIERRMTIHRIVNIADYIRYLRQDSAELEVLFRELLIEVTSFFRDPQAFETLREKVLPAIFRDRPPDEAVRIWVPGCSTGEEAYSIAMLLREYLDEVKRDYSVQIFGTDIDDQAIETARAGVYPGTIAADVSPERLKRFFSRTDSTYLIKKNIRDMLVFAVQSVIKDPPFSKLDLISCRNLLIYMGGELQKKLLPLFHYALNRDGHLFLGSSETIGNCTDLFATVHRKWKLYRRKDEAPARRQAVSLPAPPLRPDRAREEEAKEARKGTEIGFRERVERALLEDYAPACAVIDEKGEVLYIHGRTGRYLEPASGEADLNILKMAREGLQLALSTAIRRALARKEAVRSEGLHVRTNGEVEVVHLTVRPFQGPTPRQGLMMVVFEDVGPLEAAESEKPPEPPDENGRRVGELEQELRSTREYLQTTIEELETSNEELKSTNEELQSANEELQSTNEEMETSKEELQSVNEELVTVNTELETKIEELSRANNDMNNLLTSTDVGTLFLDNDLYIQRFTPAATEVISLIQTDIGRPVGDIVTKLNYDGLARDVKDVLNTLVPGVQEIRSRDGQWYSVRIAPYRTTENVIDGAVITFIDITEQKRVQEEMQEARLYAEAIVETVREPLVILDGDLRVVSANRSFHRTFRMTSQETEKRLVYELGDRQWDIPELRKLLEEILSENASFDDFEMEQAFSEIGRRRMLLNARRIDGRAGESPLILLAIEDATEK